MAELLFEEVYSAETRVTIMSDRISMSTNSFQVN